MDIWLIRHGETLWNREKRFQGHQDIALSDTGRDQARECGRQLQAVPFSALYSSDLLFATEGLHSSSPSDHAKSQCPQIYEISPQMVSMLDSLMLKVSSSKLDLLV
mgnify:CR=1 FL=1